MNNVAKTIGTKVSYAFETVSGVRPTSGYTVWCDCTSHPDFNAEREQIETTTLCQENNKTYTSGLKDYGALSFGFNLTQEIYDSFLGSNGIMAVYETKQAQGLGLWICIDIKALNVSFFIQVEPQDFGLPEGEAGSNKYDLTINFNPVGDGGWYADPEYNNLTYRVVTVSITGDHKAGATVSVLGVKSAISDENGVAKINLLDGTYDLKISNTGATTQYKEVTVNGEPVSVSVTAF